MNQLRQGDVFLVKVDELPANLTSIHCENGKIVLAHGEATGHAHTISNRVAKFFENKSGQRFLSVTNSAVLQHQEHDKISIPKGNYQVVRQCEYTPQEIRNVVD